MKFEFQILKCLSDLQSSSKSGQTIWLDSKTKETFVADFVNCVEIVEKKSRFIGFLFHCKTTDDVQEALEKLKAEHNKATHICYAYSLSNPFLEKAVDDGEPGGTAGRPILSVLQKKGVKDACVFVVRYFGGIKLGAGGLVRMYTKTTSEVLK